MQKLIIKCILLFSLFLAGFPLAIAQTPTLDEKIGQMVMIGFKGKELSPNDSIVQAILDQQVGGVILFDNASHLNIQNPAQLKKLTQQLQAYTRKAAQNHGNNLYPLFISTDYEGGKVARLKPIYGFNPTKTAALIGQGSIEEAEQQAQEMATTLQNMGINMNFAPVVDVNVNPNNPIIAKYERSFSADPAKVIEFAAIYSKAFNTQTHGIICAYKHFPGHGSSTGDTHVDQFVDVTNTWQPTELEPYKNLLQQPYACPMVMMAHVTNYHLDAKYPASLSYATISGLLRGNQPNQLNFNGVVITDALQMGAIIKNYGLEEAVKLTVNAGTDIVLVATPDSSRQVFDIIKSAVQSGQIPVERIEQSYQRIMLLKDGLRKR